MFLLSCDEECIEGHTLKIHTTHQWVSATEHTVLVQGWSQGSVGWTLSVLLPHMKHQLTLILWLVSLEWWTSSKSSLELGVVEMHWTSIISTSQNGKVYEDNKKKCATSSQSNIYCGYCTHVLWILYRHWNNSVCQNICMKEQSG